MSKQNKILICVGGGGDSSSALKFVAYKAKKNNDIIELFSVIDYSDKNFSLFSIDKVMKAEEREQAEKNMLEMAKTVHKITGQMPVTNIKEGFISDEIENLLEEDKSINLLVISSSSSSSNKGKLISSITEQISYKILIPTIIIPDNLKDSEIKRLV